MHIHSAYLVVRPNLCWVNYQLLSEEIEWRKNTKSLLLAFSKNTVFDLHKINSVIKKRGSKSQFDLFNVKK